MTKHTIASLALAGLMPAAFAGTISTGSAPTASASSSAAASSVDPFAGSVTLGYDTDYVYRGYQILSAQGEKARHLLWGAVDLNFGLSDKLSLNANVWYADSQDADYSELDIYTRLSYKVSDVLTIGPSFKWYLYPDYPGAIDNQFEPGIEAFITPWSGGSLYAGAFYETESEWFYYELGLSQTIKVNDSFSLIPGATLSFIDVESETFALDESGAHHAAVYIKAPLTIGKATLTPYVQANFPLGDQTKAAQNNIVFGGVNLSFSF